MESTPLPPTVQNHVFAQLQLQDGERTGCLHAGQMQIIDEIRHSVSSIRTLPPDIQLKARLVYYDGLRYSFAASTGVAAAAVCAALLARARGLRSTK